MDKNMPVPGNDEMPVAAPSAPVKRRQPRHERGAAGQRLHGRSLTKAKRAEFLAVLCATSSVAQAARVTGLTPQAFYALRDRDTGFATDWAAAIAQGHAALESGLLAKARGTAGPDDTLDPNLAMQILKRQDTVATTGRVGGRRSMAHAMPLRAICDELLRRIALTVARTEQGAR